MVIYGTGYDSRALRHKLIGSSLKCGENLILEEARLDWFAITTGNYTKVRVRPIPWSSQVTEKGSLKVA